MSKEDIKDLGLSCQKQLYKQSLEIRRWKIKKRAWSGSRGFNENESVYIENDLDRATAFDVWFLRECDNSPKERERLSFYYDCIKNGRYTDIVEKILDDDGYELCKRLGLESDFSDLRRELISFIGRNFSNWQEEQDCFSGVLSRGLFHLIVFTQAAALERAHPFVRESLLLNEFGLLGDSVETKKLISRFEYLRRISGVKAYVADINSEHNLSMVIEGRTSVMFKDSNYKVEIKDFWRELTSLSGSVSWNLAKVYDRCLTAVLSSFWRSDDRLHGIDKEELSSASKNLWELIDTKIREPIRSNFQNIEIDSEVLNDKDITREVALQEMVLKINEKAIYMSASPLDYLSNFEPYCSEKKFWDYAKLDIDQLILFINPFDELDMNKFIRGGRTLRESIVEGLKVHTHVAIVPGSFLVISKGMFLFINLFSIFLRYYDFPKTTHYNLSFFLDRTVSIISPGPGCLVFLENFPLPDYYRDSRNMRIVKDSFLFTMLLHKE